LTYAGILFFVFGTFLFFAGIHNIDTSMNMFRIKADLRVNITDVSVGGVVQTPEQGYLNGLLMVHSSFICFVLSFCLMLQTAITQE
jgi:hypothetical protein